MQYATKLLCLVVTVTLARAASIAGEIGLDRNAASFSSSLVFPRIPGINAPLSSILPPRPTTTTRRPSTGTTTSSPNNNSTTSSPNNNSTTSSPNNNSTTSSPNNNSTTSSPNNTSTTNSPNSNLTTRRGSSNSLFDLFDLPNPRSLIPNLPSGDSSNFAIPSIARLPHPSTMPRIPGLSNAIQMARSHVQSALNLRTDLSSGIDQAIADAFDTSNPTLAVRTLTGTILNAYATVAANCPLVIVGSRVLQEGIRLALEVARSVSNIIFGTTTDQTFG